MSLLHPPRDAQGPVIRELRFAKWGLIGWPQFLQPLEIIAEKDTYSERHFVRDCRSIAVAAFATLASCVMSDPELNAPESNGPSAHAEHIGDVFLKHAVGLFICSAQSHLGARCYPLGRHDVEYSRLSKLA